MTVLNFVQLATNVWVLLALGLVLLVVGAEILVRGASRLAVAVGVSPLVVGLTVVALGTSSPELAVTVGASLAGQADVAIGNVVGSNIFNVLFILGLSAAITSLVVSQQLVRQDVPLMIGVSVLALLLALDGEIGQLDGLLLFAGLIGYTVFLIRQSRRETAAVQAEYTEAFGGQGSQTGTAWLLNVFFIVAGLALLVVGSRWLVNGAVAAATAFGVSELIVGLTIVAAGTSLPEVATSVLASIRGERDIAVGNVVGSNIFNLMAVLGLGGLVAPEGLPVAQATLAFDMPVMIGVAVACLPIFFTGYRIARWEGWLFMAYYVAYTVYLILTVTQYEGLPVFRDALLFFIIPLTLVTLLVLSLRALRRRER